MTCMSQQGLQPPRSEKQKRIQCIRSESHRSGFKSLSSITGCLWIEDGYNPFATPPIKMWSLVPLLESGLASDCSNKETSAEAPPHRVQAAEGT